MQDSRIRLLSRVFDAKPLFRPWVKNPWTWEVAIDEWLHPLPRHTMALAAAPQAPDPAHDDMVTKCRERSAVGRNREVGIVASQHAVQPPALLIDWGMHMPAQFFLDLPDFGLQALALGLAPELEALPIRFRTTDVGKPKKVECFRLTLPTSGSTLGGKLAELDQAGFLRVQTQRKLIQPFLEIRQEAFAIVPVLKAHHRIIREAHDDQVALGVAATPLVDPQVVDIVEVDIRQQR